MQAPTTPETGGRRIVIEPLTRVEGHGKVTILLDEKGKVERARLHIVEFRGFERFIQGRPYWELPVAVQRLCGICQAAELYDPTRRDGTLLCYFRHTTSSNPFERIGEQDITAHVNFTALMKKGEALGLKKAGYAELI